MNYGFICELDESVDVSAVRNMNPDERNKYFKNMEKRCMKTESKHSKKDLNLMKFRFDKVSELEEMMKDLDMDEFQQLIYKNDADEICVSGETIQFYSMFENAVRTGYDFVYIAKHELDSLTDVLHFYYINQDIQDSLLDKYFDEFVSKKFKVITHVIQVGSVAVAVASDFIDKYVLDFVGLRKDFYNNIEMLTFTHKELDDMNSVMDSLKSDGFYLSKMLLNYGTLRGGCVDEYSVNTVCYDIENCKVMDDVSGGSTGDNGE